MNAFNVGFTAPRFRLGWILVAIGLVCALFWTLYRWNYENSYTATQLTLDFEDTRSLADAYGMSHEKLLRDFRAQGATSLALYSQTLGSLRDNARIAISSREIGQKVFPRANWANLPSEYRFVVTSSDAALLNRISARLREQVKTPDAPRPFELGDGTRAIAISDSKQLLNDVPLGFDSQQVALAKEAGYTVTARLLDPINLDAPLLERLISDVKETGANVVLFGENEVLGYESLVSSVARAFRRNGLIFTLIEFNKQSGAADFAKATEGQLVRVHSITSDEAVKLKPELVVERFIRAAKDRNMRVLYLRLLRQQRGEPREVAPGDVNARLELEKRPYQQNLEFVGKISEALKRQPLPVAFLRPGLEMAPAEAFGNYPNDQLANSLGDKGARVARFFMLWGPGLGVVGLTLLVLNLFLDLSPRAARNWLIAGLLLITGLSLSHGKGAQLMALQTGILTPVVAILWGGLPLIWDNLQRTQRLTLGGTFKLGVVTLVRTTFFTLALSLLVVAIMNHWRYMSKADEFLGEKATQWLPLLIVPLAFAGAIFPHRVAQEGVTAGRTRVKELLARASGQSFTVKTVFIGFVVLVGGFVWMARFGNESGMTISPLELALRSTLENVFIARPRTKEILLGHPAFFAAILFALARKPWLALAAMVPATIGQADVLNTMCHIHTPVFYGIWRTLMGLLIGSVFGGVALWILWRVFQIRVENEAPNGSGNQDGVGELRNSVAETRTSVA